MTGIASHGGPSAVPVPAAAGVGLRHRHVPDFLAARQPVSWLEVHSENYMAAGGPRIAALDRIRRDYPMSCHGVGLSLGSAEGISRAHLRRLRCLIERVEPGLVSEHLAWCVVDGAYLNDLLPLPYTDESLRVVCRNVEVAQHTLGRQVLVENPSAYLPLVDTVIPEPEFLAELVARTGCGLLLDVNNVHVSAANLGLDAAAYLDRIPAKAVREIHVAGHAHARLLGRPVLIDDHGSCVPAPVWDLLRRLLGRTGPLPVLVEWDTRIPDLEILLAEAGVAQSAIDAAVTDRQVGHAA